MNLPYDKSLTIDEVREKLWQDRIYPLLYEYVRGSGKEEEQMKQCKESFGISL